MPSQNIDDDLPTYQEPGIIRFLAATLMGRAGSRRDVQQAAPRPPARVRVRQQRSQAESATGPAADHRRSRPEEEQNEAQALPRHPIHAEQFEAGPQEDRQRVRMRRRTSEPVVRRAVSELDK